LSRATGNLNGKINKIIFGDYYTSSIIDFQRNYLASFFKYPQILFSKISGSLYYEPLYNSSSILTVTIGKVGHSCYTCTMTAQLNVGERILGMFLLVRRFFRPENLTLSFIYNDMAVNFSCFTPFFVISSWLKPLISLALPLTAIISKHLSSVR